MYPEQNQGKPPIAPTATAVPPSTKVAFGRRTPSGRYISYSREDLESELGSVDFNSYHVQFPMTPDNQPMEVVPVDPFVSAKAEEHYVSSSLFTGGFNSVTRAHMMDKVTDSNPNRSAAAKASTCAVEGCDGKVMCDERGEEMLPCECEFKICGDCFGDAVKNGGKLCPGCKEPYKATDVEEVSRIAKERKAITVPRISASKAGARMERRLSMMRSMKGGATSEFEHNRWLFETKGTYGYGNAIWPEADEVGHDGGDEAHHKDFVSKPWRPLTRKLKIPAAILSPYRSDYSVLALFFYIEINCH